MISNWSIGGIWVGPLLILLLCTLFTLSNQAATRQVPADLPTIQQALDASSDGDSVVVAAGIWFGSLDFGGRDLVLLGSGTSTCILQGLAGRLLVFSRGESSAARLEGFTLRQGQAPTGASNAGGAILIRDSSPTLRGNRFELCSARQGGAVALIRSSSLLEGNEFDTNQAFMGGAVYVMGGAPELRSNRFLHNTGGLRGYGGALSLESTAARVRQNLFVENGAFLGGAISCRLSPEALIERNTIAGNEARMGGGLYLAAGDPLVQGNLVAWSAQGEAAASALMASPVLGCNLHFDNAGGDGFPGRRQRLYECTDIKRTIKADNDDADLLAFFSQVFGGGMCRFCAGPHHDNHFFCIWCTNVIKNMILTTGEFCKLVHCFLDNAGRRLIEWIDAFPCLEEHIGILGCPTHNRCVRGETSRTMCVYQFIVNHFAEYRFR